MTSCQLFLSSLERLYADLEQAEKAAVAEGDVWTGIAVGMVRQAVLDASLAAEVERRKRGGS